MASVSVHPILPASVVSQKHYFPPSKTAYKFSSPRRIRVAKTHALRPAAVIASDAESAATTEEISGFELGQEFLQEPEPPQVAGKDGRSIVKPRLVLKFIWMDKNIGLGLDQLQPRHGSVPLSPYFFWPRKDAWEELKAVLESKPWISQKKMIILLNQATDIINLWQQSGANAS